MAAMFTVMAAVYEGDKTNRLTEYDDSGIEPYTSGAGNRGVETERVLMLHELRDAFRKRNVSALPS